MVNKELEVLVYKLKDLKSLRDLFSELNFDFVDKPVNKDGWTTEQKNIVKKSKIIASKVDYCIYYIQTNTNSLNQWKGIASKIIKDNYGLCMICSHNPGGFKWVFSSISKEFSKSFSETRHIPIDININTGIPKTFLDFLEKIRVDKGSFTYSIATKISNAFDTLAIQIHDELTVNVFEALKILSEGIISDRTNNLILSKYVIEEIRESIFILLYRIMFVLYAEDRSIFPDNKFYYEHFSLNWIKINWILKSDPNINEYRVNERLKKLFRLIEMGSEYLNYEPKEFSMRSYYGRLFDRKIHSKLEKWNIPNKTLLDAINLLTRTRDEQGNYFFLDYAALETRHLGAIYEHLLEYHLIVKDGKITDLPNPKDRKSTGSYYTPPYVVEQIIKNTVDPLLDDILSKTTNEDEIIKKILELKILDPAMGSGNFLVGVTNHIAYRICQIEHENDNDITEQNFIDRKRDVVRKCIYGVDLNPLSVDLAQVSLWLETLYSEKPLAFLSTHLKCGNSLIGTQIETIFDKQTTLFESKKIRNVFQKNMKKFLMFENLEDDSPSVVKMKSDEYHDMQLEGTLYSDLKFLLDCKVAEMCKIKIPILFHDQDIKIDKNNTTFYTNEQFQMITDLSNHKRFFHWDLEFPQIFYNENGEKRSNAGFDAIVGNPPWVFTRGKNLTATEKTYFNHFIKKLNIVQVLKGRNIQSGKLNLYSLFILKVDILKNDGRYGIITPNNLLRATTYDLVRKFILDTFSIVQIFDLGTNIFKGVSASSVIIDLQKTTDGQIRNQNNVKIVHEIKDIKNLNYKSHTINQSVFYQNPSHVFNILLDDKTLKLNKIILDNTIPLNKICKYIGEGIVGSLDRDVFTTKKEKNYKPFIIGKDIKRYLINFKHRFVRYDNKLLHRSRPEDMFLSDKIILQRISGGTKPLVAAVDKDQFYTFASVNNLVLNKNTKFKLEYIAAILNSDLINWYYSINFSNKSKLTVNISRTYLEQIPIKIISLNTQEKFVNLVNKLSDLKIQNSSDNVDMSIKLAIREIEEELNEQIYKLYGVNKKDIKI